MTDLPAPASSSQTGSSELRAAVHAILERRVADDTADDLTEAVMGPVQAVLDQIAAMNAAQAAVTTEIDDKAIQAYEERDAALHRAEQTETDLAEMRTIATERSEACARAEVERDELKIENALMANDQMDLAEAKKETEKLRAHILDIAAHATPYGDLPEDPGYVGTYLLTAGALHRALGTIGHTSPSCTAEAERDQLRAAATKASDLLWNADLHPEPVACLGRVPSISSECGVCRAWAILRAALGLDQPAKEDTP